VGPRAFFWRWQQYFFPARRAGAIGGAGAVLAALTKIS
jgi:hypothetical protein